jgi:hypothetical protein
MLSLIKKLFGAKPTQLEVEVKAEAASYKVPEPAATTPIPLVPVAGLMLPVEGAGEVAVPAKKARAKKPAAPKADKPATAKKPRTPKAK